MKRMLIGHLLIALAFIQAGCMAPQSTIQNHNVLGTEARKGFVEFYAGITLPDDYVATPDDLFVVSQVADSRQTVVCGTVRSDRFKGTRLRVACLPGRCRFSIMFGGTLNPASARIVEVPIEEGMVTPVRLLFNVRSIGGTDKSTTWEGAIDVAVGIPRNFYAKLSNEYAVYRQKFSPSVYSQGGLSQTEATIEATSPEEATETRRRLDQAQAGLDLSIPKDRETFVRRYAPNPGTPAARGVLVRISNTKGTSSLCTLLLPE